jgi:hypothetical protein
MPIEDSTTVEYAAAREDNIDPGSLAVYTGSWTTREVAEILVSQANLHLPIDPPYEPWALWTRIRTITGVRKVAGPSTLPASPAPPGGGGPGFGDPATGG